MRQIKLSSLESPIDTKALVHLQEHLLRMNGPQAYRAQNLAMMGLIINRFLKEERIEEIVKQKPEEITLVDGSPIALLADKEATSLSMLSRCGAAFRWRRSRHLR